MEKTIFLFSFIALMSCKCLPQIPPQKIYADGNCEAVIPNYLQYITVRDNCGNVTLIQKPLPGTILDADNPYIQIVITATDISGNTDVERFDVLLVDTIPPVIIWDSIPSDTIAYQRNDIDLLFDSVDKYRTYLGAEKQDEILIRRLR